MLRKSSPPIDPRRGEAPTTATERGSKNGRSEAVTATWSRSSTRAVNAAVRAIGNLTSTTPPSSVRVGLKPMFSNTPSIEAFSGSTSATNSSIPALAGPRCELLEQPRSDAAPLPAVGDRERSLCDPAVPQPHVVRRPRRSLSSPGSPLTPIKRALLVPVRLDHRPDQALARDRKPVESQEAAPIREPGEEGGERRRASSARGRPQPQRGAVAKDHVDRSFTRSTLPVSALTSSSVRCVADVPASGRRPQPVRKARIGCMPNTPPNTPVDE